MTGRTAERAVRRARRRFRRAVVAVAVVIGAFAVVMSQNSGDDPLWTAVNDVGQLVAAITAAVAGIVTFRRTAGRERWGWGAIAGGASAWAAGQAIWTYYEVIQRSEVPSPGAADVGFIVAPVLWIAGILLFVDTPAGMRSQLSGLVEGLMIAGGIFVPTWTFALGPVVRESNVSALQQFVNLAYPVFDIFVLATLLFALTRSRTQTRGSLAVMALGMGAIAVADSGFWYLNSFDSYFGANLFDLGWFGGFLILALGSSHAGQGVRRGRRRGRDRGWHALSIPDLIFAVGLCATLIVIVNVGVVEFGAFEEYLTLGLVAVGFAHRLAVLSENHSLTVGLECRVRERTGELENRERYFAALVRSSSDIITVIDASRTIRSVSASVADIYGWNPDRFADRPLAGTSPFGGLDGVLDQAVADPDRVHRVEWKLVDRFGVERSAESTVSNLLDDADIGCFVVNTRDVTDRASLESQLRHQAFHDPLTGLPNRALFADRAGHALRRSAVTGSRIGIAMVDLDGFKGVNDSHGHQAGDGVLRAVADQLARSLDRGETVARLGGDEFAILVEDLDDTVDPAAIAQRLLDSVRLLVEVDGFQYEVRASVGFAVSSRASSHPAEAVQELLRDADIAMYSAKREGRGRARIFRPEMYADAHHAFELQSELRGAIDRGEMVLYYQPTFSLASGNVSGFEALVRWQHPQKGIVSPAKFIPLAEETGLIVPLGDWVLRTAVNQLAAWSREFGDGGEMSMAINVSVGQLRSPHLYESLRSVIDDAGIDPRRIVLEITESMLISDAETVVGLLRQMSDLGVRIAIDDFGTGYASLANLQSLPLDILKIDRTFVSGESEGDGLPLLTTILNIGRTLGLETVGEGIETEDQLSVLRAGGCDVGQGYFLSRPLPPTEIHDMLRARRDADRRGCEVAVPIGAV